ncbi:MFS transporter [Streptomyces pactum]|uniref:MFS transporter n=1 Tax=Streptomyces pactum TaxID=68249 RepID=UPI0036FE4D79
MRERVTTIGSGSSAQDLRTRGRGRRFVRVLRNPFAATGRGIRRATHAHGAGESGLGKLIELHAVNSAGDMMVTIALASTVFFSVPTDEARGRVALYLAITMAPFAVLAPVVGPLLDRIPHGRRAAMATSMGSRAVLALTMSTAVAGGGLELYPAALGVLVASKAYGVVRSAVVPRLLPPRFSLVKANSRVTLAGLLATGLAAPVGGGLHQIGPEWPLYGACVVFSIGTFLSFTLPPKVDSAKGEARARLTSGEHHLHLPHLPHHAHPAHPANPARAALPAAGATGTAGSTRVDGTAGATGTAGTAAGTGIPGGAPGGAPAENPVPGSAEGPPRPADAPRTSPDGPTAGGSAPSGPAADGSTAVGEGHRPPVGPAEATTVEGPVTDGPATADARVTDGPATTGPVTDGPVTDGPVTDGPVTDGPVTDGTVADGPAAGKRGGRRKGRRNGGSARGRRPGLRTVGPSVLHALQACSSLKALSGFLTLFLAFLLREHPLAGLSPEVSLGVVAVSAGLGNALGTAIGAWLRARGPELIIAVVLLGALGVLVITAALFSTVLVAAVAATAGLAQALGKLSLDALIQRDVPEEVRTSAFSRSETTLQLAWVVGGGIGISLPLSGALGMSVAAGLIALGALAAVRGLLGAGRRGSPYPRVA